MKRTTRTAALAALLATSSTPVLAQSGDIHGVDFRNFSYSAACLYDESGTVAVKNGEYSRDEGDDKVYFKVTDVVYGDLTGDGADEAVVTTLCNTGGTGNFTDGTVFTMRGGKPVVVDTLGMGDRADGGIHAVRIEGGKLYVDRYGQEHSGACCPEYVDTHAFRYAGGKLSEAGKAVRRGYAWYGSDDSPAPHRVRFLRGTSAVSLSGFTNDGESYLLGARAGQTMSLDFQSKDAKAVLTMTSGGVSVATLRPGASWSGKLPSNGDYVLAIASSTSRDATDTDYQLELSIQ